VEVREAGHPASVKAATPAPPVAPKAQALTGGGWSGSEEFRPRTLVVETLEGKP